MKSLLKFGVVLLVFGVMLSILGVGIIRGHAVKPAPVVPTTSATAAPVANATFDASASMSTSGAASTPIKP